MAKYSYKAFDASHTIIKGIVEEDDISVAKDVLVSRGLQVIAIRKKIVLGDVRIGGGLTMEQLSGFCGEVAVILGSGVSILRGLEILYEQATDRYYKRVIGDMQKNVKKGMNLSLAMEQTKSFPDLLVDMVASGEVSSHLVDVLFSMEDFYGREASIRSKIKGAAIYPLILLGVAIVMVIFFNLFVFSELKKLFAGMDDLPLMTRTLIGGMDYMNEHPLTIMGVAVGSFFLIYILREMPLLRLFFDRTSLQMPVIGQVKKDIIAARVSASMAIFIQSAVPLTKVLEVVSTIAANRHTSRLIDEAKEEIIRGRNISDAFEEAGAFETMVVQMIRIGEETGKLEEMLFKLASIYEKKSSTGIARLVALIEPMFTLVVGLVVGVVIFAMAMPIFNMSSLLGR